MSKSKEIERAAQDLVEVMENLPGKMVSSTICKMIGKIRERYEAAPYNSVRRESLGRILVKYDKPFK
jgi:hypothetical protein